MSPIPARWFFSATRCDNDIGGYPEHALMAGSAYRLKFVNAKAALI